MNERHRGTVTDEICWYCPTCKKTSSIRKNTFFDKSRLPLNKWLFLICLWSRDYPVSLAADDAEVSRVSAINIYQWLREVCSTKLLQIPIILGGRGTIVQIDESLFSHKPKVSVCICSCGMCFCVLS